MSRLLAVFGLVVLGCGAEPFADEHGSAVRGKADGLAAERTWHGSQRALVVLLDWNNTESTVTRDQLDTTFFSNDDRTSLRRFFLENSAGSFDLTGDVLDWRHSQQEWSSDTGCDLDPIVRAAWTVFGEDVEIANYDADDNGLVDNLFVVHSGRIGSDRVGPDCTFTQFDRADRTIVFQSQGLGSIGDAIPIGFYVHEGGHLYYSLPDLYADHYHGRYGIGMWGMMGLGAWGVSNKILRPEMFRVPAHFEPLSKVVIGWVSPRVISTTQRAVLLSPVELTNDIIQVPIANGSYYLEYRSARGFSLGHRGHGLLVWNNYDLVQADGRDDLNNGTDLGYRPLPPISENFGDSTDPFPGTNRVTSYADPANGVSFENIRELEGHIQLDIVITGQVTHVDAPRQTWDGVERL
jgi:M6 family metalloprotease-like protein